MTAPIKSFHTHAEGELKGWWGRVIHPAHLKQETRKLNENPLAEETAWSEDVSSASLESINAAAEAAIRRHSNLTQ